MASPDETPDAEVQDSTSRTGLSMLQVMWQRKSLVILGVMLGLVLGLLYYAQRQPVYESRAMILVVKKSPTEPIDRSGGSDSRMAYMEDYMATQSVLIRSPEIIGRAIRTPKLQDLKSFPAETVNGNGPELINAIQQALQVARDTKESTTGAPTNILTLSLRGPVAEECPKIVDAVIDSYQSFLNETYKNVSESTVDQINSAKELLQGKVEQQQQQLADLRAKSPYVVLSSLGDKAGSKNIFAERLGKIETRRAELQIKMQEMTDQLAQIEQKYKEGGSAAARHAINALGVKLTMYNNQEVSKLDEQLLQLRVQKQRLLNTLGPNHPQVKEIDETIRLVKQIYKGGAGAGAEVDDAARPDPDNVLSYIAVMKEEVKSLETLIGSLNNMFDTESAKARDMGKYVSEEERLQNSLELSRDILKGIAKKLQETNLVKDFGGYVARPIAPPGLGRKVAPNPMTVFPLSGIGGLVAGLCLAYLAELSDKSFRTPTEIRRRLGLPVIGHIPYYAPDEKAAKQVAAGEPVVDPMLYTHYQPSSVPSESYRSVRTALYFNTHGVGHQVIQVTSPNVSDGKSTLAANLAVSIAQSGKRTLMIDADCRRPRAHKIFNVPADTGLATVIAGQTDLASAIRPSAIPNLSVLPCGPRPANPAELLTSPRFKELLDIIRSQYDFVILDTPPLLVVTDPCVVAPRVDGVILAIRVVKNGRPFAERAKEILTSLGANVLGVVVNGLGSPAGGKYGYGYDQYQYGYGYTYRYSYTYADEYTDDKAASYYNSDAGAAPTEQK
ncbi:MAG TPA: polysaccharide biosynthesis tyrosine autokinase [Gemmataceae bacterium]